MPPPGQRNNETTSVMGYGAPTKGSYNSTDKGFKTFGTVGQGPNTEGTKDPRAPMDGDRQMAVTIVAVADQSTDTILLELGNYEFLDEYSWDSAVTRAVSFAALAIISSAMF
jgi:hypothetical protein